MRFALEWTRLRQLVKEQLTREARILTPGSRVEVCSTYSDTHRESVFVSSSLSRCELLLALPVDIFVLLRERESCTE
jgi:hypothetical protein